MFRRLLKTESGYSLIEVIVSIIILALALLPMAAMFDMGVNSATSDGQYDRARALANMKMEEAKSLSYANVRDNFPQAGNATPYTTGSPITGPTGFTGFQYTVQKHYVTKPSDPPSSTFTFSTTNTDTGLIRVTVVVQWGGGKTYTTYGLVGQ